jgi:NAD+ diphosphatase
MDMLKSPDTFDVDVSVELAEDAFAHVFIRDKLIQFPDAPGMRNWRDYQALGFEPARVHGLGRFDGQNHVAVTLSDDASEHPLPDVVKADGLRAWFGVLDDTALSIAMRAVQVVEWDRTHQFCGACGQPTTQSGSERARSCKACRLTMYPRICPAMMVQITRGREMLLGRGINFPPGRYSALAGFLEAGETIEQAVHREVMEEVGLRVQNLQYFGSQSWPFPNSLMIAFTAEYRDGELNFDTDELADAQWFDIDALPQLPPRLSVAGALLKHTIQRIRNEHE